MAYPVGEAQMRVVCGEGAAMAFNKVGIRYDITNYRWAMNEAKQPPTFGLSFHVVALTHKAKGDKVNVMVTVPHFNLRQVVVRVGSPTHPTPRQVTAVTFLERPDTLLIRDVQVGDEVIIGEVAPDTPVIKCNIAKVRRAVLH